MIKILTVERNSRNGNGTAICSFKEGAGTFRLNKIALQSLGLEHGNLINFSYDDEENRFYVFKSNTDGYKIRICNNGKEAIASCIEVVRRIVEKYRLNVITDAPSSHRKYIDTAPIQFIDQDTGEQIAMFKIKLTEKESSPNLS